MDSSKHRRVVQALRDHGFSPVRVTTHGTMWQRADKVFLLNRSGPSGDHRSWLNARAELRRMGISLERADHSKCAIQNCAKR